MATRCCSEVDHTYVEACLDHHQQGQDSAPSTPLNYTHQRYPQLHQSRRSPLQLMLSAPCSPTTTAETYTTASSLSASPSSIMSPPGLVVLDNPTNTCDPGDEPAAAVRRPTTGAGAPGAPPLRTRSAASVNHGRKGVVDKRDALAIAAGRCTLLWATGNPTVVHENISSQSAAAAAAAIVLSPSVDRAAMGTTVAAVRSALIATTTTATTARNSGDVMANAHMQGEEIEVEEGDAAVPVTDITALQQRSLSMLSMATTVVAANNSSGPLELPSPKKVAAAHQAASAATAGGGPGGNNGNIRRACVCVPDGVNSTQGVCNLRRPIAPTAGGGGPASAVATGSLRSNVIEHNTSNITTRTTSSFTNNNVKYKRHSGSTPPFHMLPFEVREHLLTQSSSSSFFTALRELRDDDDDDKDEQERGDTGDYRSKSNCDRHSQPILSAAAAEWFPLLPPAMAAKQALHTSPDPNTREYARAASVGISPVDARRESRSCFSAAKAGGGDYLTDIEPSCLGILGGAARGFEIPEKISMPEPASACTTASRASYASACSPQAFSDDMQQDDAVNGVEEEDGERPDANITALGLLAMSGYAEASLLQLISLEMSNACRVGVPWSLMITESTPQHLMDHIWPGSGATATEPLSRSRLIHCRKITKVTLMADRIVTYATWPSTMTHLELGAFFDRPVEGVAWPPGLESISFGARFNQPVARVNWPPALQELLFGNDFNQPVSGLNLPAGLRKLEFGERFNHCIGAVNWPEDLRHLRFGRGFNRPIAAVNWPPGLEDLEFCGQFDQRVERVSWPPGLKRLGLLGFFNQPVKAVEWPAGLKSVRFGNNFKAPLKAVKWPQGLEQVLLGDAYNRDLSQVVWPESLKELTVSSEVFLGKDRSNIPGSCKVTTIFKNTSDRREDAEMSHMGAFFGSDMEDDIEEVYYNTAQDENSEGAYGIDVFGYEVWDMAESWDSRAHSLYQSAR